MQIEVKKSIRAMASAGVLAGALTGMALLGQNAHAASGQTKVDVSFPPLIILYYYDQIELNLSATDLTTATDLGSLGCVASTPGVGCEVSPGAAVTPTLTAASGAITAAGNIATDAPGIGLLDTTINFDINGAWAVRALAASNLTAEVKDAAAGGEFSSIGTSLTSVTPSLTLGAGNIGDITFSVDLTTLANPSVATDDVLITITGP